MMINDLNDVTQGFKLGILIMINQTEQELRPTCDERGETTCLMVCGKQWEKEENAWMNTKVK